MRSPGSVDDRPCPGGGEGKAAPRLAERLASAVEKEVGRDGFSVFSEMVLRILQSLSIFVAAVVEYASYPEGWVVVLAVDDHCVRTSSVLSSSSSMSFRASSTSLVSSKELSSWWESGSPLSTSISISHSEFPFELPT